MSIGSIWPGFLTGDYKLFIIKLYLTTVDLCS